MAVVTAVTAICGGFLAQRNDAAVVRTLELDFAPGSS
jgi:hypothetical protein